MKSNEIRGINPFISNPMSKNKRVRITNSRVNSYGARVLTEGGDLHQYERNPVLLYMHERGQVIGCMRDIRIAGDEMSGEPVFDEASELSRRCKKQWEFGSLRMVSIGIDILETSTAPELLLPGQTRPTITKWRLDEISIVDIGANDDAIVLRRDGKRIELGKDGECHLLPLINNQPKIEEMEIKELALLLGLPETADEVAVKAKVSELQKMAEDVARLRTQVDALTKEKEALTLARITAAVDKAIAEKRLESAKKSQFIELGEKVGIEELDGIFDSMAPKTKLSAALNGSSGSTSNEWKTLYDVPADKMMELRTEDPEEYQRLYKATYSF